MPPDTECVICEHAEQEKRTDDFQYVEVHQKGLQTLKSFSSKRKEQSLLNHLINCEKNGIAVKVHIKCRRNFTDSKRLSSAEKAPEPIVKKKRLRSTDSGF